MDSRNTKIVFSDGRKGYQIETRDEGNWKLTGVVVTREADGTPCQHVYDAHPDLRSRVFSLHDLGNVTWQVA
jgi:hypothetical protein